MLLDFNLFPDSNKAIYRKLTAWIESFFTATTKQQETLNEKRVKFCAIFLLRHIIDPLLINQPVQDSFGSSLHDQNMTSGIVLCFMDRELEENAQEEMWGHCGICFKNNTHMRFIVDCLLLVWFFIYYFFYFVFTAVIFSNWLKKNHLKVELTECTLKVICMPYVEGTFIYPIAYIPLV